MYIKYHFKATMTYLPVFILDKYHSHLVGHLKERNSYQQSKLSINHLISHYTFEEHTGTTLKD